MSVITSQIGRQRMILPTATTALVFSILVGGNLLESFRVVFLLSLNLAAADVWITTFLRDQASQFSNWKSIKLLVATAGPALISAAFSFSGLSSVSGLVLFPLSALAVFSGAHLSGRSVSEVEREGECKPENHSYYFWASLGVATVVFAWDYSILIFIGVFACLNHRSLGFSSTRISAQKFYLSLLTAAGSFIAVKYSFDLVPIKLRWSDADLLWDESMSWAAQRQFMVENPFYAGEPFRIYQLGNLWAGDYSRTLSLSTFEFLSSTGIAIGLLLILFAAQDLFTLLSEERSWFFPIILVLCAQAIVPDDWVLVEALRVPNVLGLGWAIGCITLYLAWTGEGSKTLFVLFCLMVIGVALCKSPYSINVALFVAGHQLTTTFRGDRRRKRVGGWSLVVVSVFVAVIAVFALGGPRSSTVVAFSMASALGGLQLILFRCFAGVSGLRGSRDLQNFSWAVLLSTWGIGTIYVIVRNDGAFHLMSLQFAICAIPTAAYLRQLEIRELMVARRFWYLATYTVGVVIAIGYWIAKIPLERREFMFMGGLDGVLRLIYVVMAVSGFLFLVLVNWPSRISLNFLIPTVVILNAGLYVGHGFRQQVEYSFHQVETRTSSLSSDERFQVGNWLRTNTSVNSLVAGNLVCVALNVDKDTPAIDGDCKRRNRESWLSATSQRKQFLEAPLWSQIGEILEPSQSFRYRLLMSLNVSDFDLYLTEIRAEGVDYFVLDRTNLADSNDPIVTSCGKQIFESSNFIVFDLYGCGSTTSTVQDGALPIALDRRSI